MQKRWMVAVLATVGLGLVSVPFLRTGGNERGNGGAADTGTSASAPLPAVCDAKPRQARLDFTLPDMHGADVELSSFDGKVLAINFWATWCAPCRHEIPIFVGLQERYRDREFTFVGISIQDDSLEPLRAFAKQFEMNYPVLQGSHHAELQRAYGPLPGIPVTVLLSRDGQECKRFIGFPGEAPFEQAIEALL